MLKVKVFQFGQMMTNSYLVWSDDKIGYLFDVGGKNINKLETFIKENNITLKYMILTHGHGDHIDGVKEVLANHREAELYIGKEEEEFLTNTNYNLTSYMLAQPFIYTGNYHTVKEGDMIGEFRVIDTPGHTKGSKCFYSEESNILISGDTMFHNSFGRYDLPTANGDELFLSLKKLVEMLPPETIVLSGHTDSTTIKNEKIFLKRIGII